MRSDRPADIARGFCPQCGWELPASHVRWNKQDVAEHNLHHLVWEKAPVRRLVDAQADLIGELYACIKRWRDRGGDLERQNEKLRAKVVDLEIELGSVSWDLKVAYELVDDLKVDLHDVEDLAATRDRHPANQAGADE